MMETLIFIIFRVKTIRSSGVARVGRLVGQDEKIFADQTPKN